MTNTNKKEANKIPQALTSGELAKRAGCHSHQVLYFLRSRKIEPDSMVAHYRIYAPAVLGKLRAHLKKNKQPA